MENGGMMTGRLLRRLPALAAALVVALPFPSHADDAVGLMRLTAETNAETVVEMPFIPFGGGTPTNFLSGPFFGDGESLPDWLYVYPESCETNFEAAFSPDGWVDPATGAPSSATAQPGDTLVFIPGEGGDDSPFDFFLFGRAPDVAARSGSPLIRSLSVDPLGAFADIGVFTRGFATDVFAADFLTNGVGSATWEHLGRHPGHPVLMDLRDDALPLAGGRLYLAADATRDTDGDGLPDEMERRIYGTSPYLADTDGDGVLDSQELAWGCDPLFAEAIRPLTLLAESFEPPEVHSGPVCGQNGWIADGAPARVSVQGEITVEGQGALGIYGANASHSVTGSADVVWIDLMEYPVSGTPWVEDYENDTMLFLFTTNGNPVMSDGPALFTNRLFSVSGWKRWIRSTVKMDYRSRTCDFYVDGVAVGVNLRMRGDATEMHEVVFSGEAFLDGIVISTERPTGLSLDGDALPDEWEIARFGDLSHDGSGDSDGDGMTDLEEFHAGTDPMAPNGDTDGDGLPDWWEAENGLNPFDADAPVPAALRETFEQPDVALGDISGQNGWIASETNAAIVQSAVVHGGGAALEVAGESSGDGGVSVEVWHPAASRAEVVWLDLWQLRCGVEYRLDADPDAFAVFALDDSGHPVMSDGGCLVTNTAFSVESGDVWARLSGRFDFPCRKWDFYLNGLLVGNGLAMRGDSGSIHSFGISGGRGCIDDIYIGFARPEGLSSDGDALPDEWELVHFGSLGRDGSGDYDGDGMSDAQEFAAGTNPTAADTDGDGIVDSWEVAHGLDPLNPADAFADPDGDGLSTLDEYGIGTNHLLADTDGDGMPDGWEAANGTDPFAPDALEDPDRDGLVNIGEMRHGTDWLLADTDGDGVSDYMEILNSRSDPLVADIAWGAPVDAGARVDGSGYSASTGTWHADGDGAAYAAERAGSLTWRLSVPAGGADALAVGIGQHNRFATAKTFDLSLYVDGLFVARQIVFAPYGTRADAFFFLPETPPGEHDFRLVWHNWAVNTFLAVYDLRFVTFGGPDEDEDGIPDWKNHRAGEASALDALPLESLVSPLCIEGRDLWRDVLEIEVATAETNLVYAPVKTIGDGFYADIPLPTNGAAVVSMRDRSLADSFAVEWKALDVFVGEFATNALTIRTGDALKIAPFNGDAESDVAISRATAAGTWEPVTNWTEAVATPYPFDVAGLYLVTVTHAGLLLEDTASALVDVVRSRFPKRNPAILMDAEQTLDCPALSPRNLLEHDAGLQVGAEVAGGGVSLSLLTHESRDLGLVSRLGEDGAISDAVQVTPVWADNGTYFHVLDNYGDGSQLIEVSLLLGAIPEGTTVTLSIFVSGVTFEDGTRTKTLTADDFDENGHVAVRFIRARGVKTSVCHSTRIYQDGKLIYKNR